MHNFQITSPGNRLLMPSIFPVFLVPFHQGQSHPLLPWGGCFKKLPPGISHPALKHHNKITKREKPPGSRRNRLSRFRFISYLSVSFVPVLPALFTHLLLIAAVRLFFLSVRLIPLDYVPDLLTLKPQLPAGHSCQIILADQIHLKPKGTLLLHPEIVHGSV